MAPRTITVPDFDFAGGYFYPQLLERLILHLRANVPEITNESPGEPAIQLLRCFALVGHLNACLIDLVSHEALMVTAQLRDSLVAHLKLIGYEVAGDVPARATVVLTLSKTFTSTTQVLPAGALFGTRRLASVEPVIFEADESVSVTRTDHVTAAFVYDASGPTWTDRTTAANTDSSTWSVLPATPAPGDALYVGHAEVMTNRLNALGITTGMSGIVGVWEYSDEEVEESFPDSVAIAGSGVALKLVIDDLLGAPGRSLAGLEVTITLNATGAQETATSAWDGTNNYVESSGFLGQTSPSLEERDYSVGTQWHPLPGLDDDTNTGSTTLQADGNIDFTLPKTSTDDWQPIAVNGVTAFWLRFRVISVSTPVEAVLDRLRWNRRDTFVQVPVTQGRTRTEVLGSSTGDASQVFTLGSTNVIPGTVAISVDSIAWTEVQNFLNSTSVDEHFAIEVDSNGTGTVFFGDGVTGKIPPAGTNNVTAVYRTDANTNGNTGADTITINRSGVAAVKRITNPRPASGWYERRGATAEDRERLKLEGPASLRTLGRAVSAADVEFLATQFQASDGSYPFVRAEAIEFGFGEKTVKAVVVGPGGAATLAGKRRELETYFNGDVETGESGIMVANQRVFVRDYVPASIDVTATITGGNPESIETAIRGLLSPTGRVQVAQADGTLIDGTEFLWRFGQTVTVAKINATIFRADPSVENVVLTTPAADVLLDADELPTVGTLTLTFN